MENLENLLLYFSKKSIMWILYNQYSNMVYYLIDQYHLS